MKGFIESAYCFDFTDDWDVIKYDEHRFYKMLSGHSMSGVDFAGVFNEDSLYLIEVKNFKHLKAKQNEKTLDAFVLEIMEKGKDSLHLIRVIKKYLARKFWYKALYSLVNRFPWLNPEWYLWTEFYRFSIVEKKANFVLLIDSDYDLKELEQRLKEGLLTHYQQVIVLPILASKSIEGLNVSAV